MGQHFKIFIVITFFFTRAYAVIQSSMLYSQDWGLWPKILLQGEELLLVESSTGNAKAHLYTPLTEGTYSLERYWQIGRASVVRVTTSPRGWVASCSSNGEALYYFHLERKKVESIDFSHKPYHCAGVAIVDGEIPKFWIGSVVSQELLLLNTSGTVLYRYESISGPTRFSLIGDTFFSINASYFKEAQRPLIFDALSGATLVGNSKGDPGKTALRGGYSSQFYDDSHVSRRVYYFNGINKEIHGFPIDFPTEANFITTHLVVDSPIAMGRYGNCLVVMGSIEKKGAKISHFSILKEVDRKLTEVTVKSANSSGLLQQGIEMVINNSGEMFVSQRNGVIQIKGVFDGLDCVPVIP